MTEIYILRHAQTQSNLRNACIGSMDIPLNEAGKEQAEKVCACLSDVKFDVIYTSPLSRAIDTITPYVKNNPLVPVHMSYAFSERDFGEWENMTYAEIKQKSPDMYQKWQENPVSFKMPGGESMDDVRERVDGAISKILSLHKGKKVLIVTHLLAGRVTIASLLGIPNSLEKSFFIDNASFAKVEYKDGKGILTSLNG